MHHSAICPLPPPQAHLPRNLQHRFGRIDRGCDRRDTHKVGRQHAQPFTQHVGAKVVHHRVKEMDVVNPCPLQMPGQIGQPGRRPVPGDLGPAGMIVRVDKDDAHWGSSRLPTQIDSLRAGPT
jgi:hypothetical protein